jgi:hypothetical protein
MNTAPRQIKVASLFTDYRIQSNAENEITLSISPEALLLALRSAANPPSLSSAPDVVMKLAKKNDQAVLSFEISGAMASGRKVNVGHDVRIDVLRPSDVKKLAEPMCPEPDVRAHLLTHTWTDLCALWRFTSCFRRCRNCERLSKDFGRFLIS